MESDSSSSSDGTPTSRSELVELVLETITTGLDWTLVSPLGRGTFGDVFHMRDPSRQPQQDIAVKIVAPENVVDREAELWPLLEHPHVLRLLEMLSLEDPLGVVLFVTPLMRTSLYDVLHERGRGGFSEVRRWMFEVMLALEYVVDRGFCHLDVKVDNVLVSEEGKAVLCDFSFLNSCKKPLERYALGLPYIYRPPEVCPSLGMEIFVDGVAYDMWGYGIMSMEILTHFVIASLRDKNECWKKDMYPLLYDSLQEETFAGYVTLAFPADIKEIDLNLALDFLHSFLQTNASKRPLPSFAKEHAFLNHGSESGCVKDEIWIENIDQLKATKQIASKRETLTRNDNQFSPENVTYSEYTLEDIISGLSYLDNEDSLRNDPLNRNVSQSSDSFFHQPQSLPCTSKSLQCKNSSDSDSSYSSCELASPELFTQLGYKGKEKTEPSFLLVGYNVGDQQVTRRWTVPLNSKKRGRNIWSHRSCPSLNIPSREIESSKPFSGMKIDKNETDTIVLQMSYESGDSEFIGGFEDKFKMFQITHEDMEKYSVPFEVKASDPSKSPEIIGKNFKSLMSSLSFIRKMESHYFLPDKHIDEKVESTGTDILCKGNEKEDEVAFETNTAMESSHKDKTACSEEMSKFNSVLTKNMRIKYASQSLPNLSVVTSMDIGLSEYMKIVDSFKIRSGNKSPCYPRNIVDGKKVKEKARSGKLPEIHRKLTEQQKKSFKSNVFNKGCTYANERKKQKVHVVRKLINWFERSLTMGCTLKRYKRKPK